MIGYTKISPLRAPTRRTVRLNVFGGFTTERGENTLPLQRSILSYNVDSSDGTLRELTGLKRACYVGRDGVGYEMPDFVSPIVRDYWYYRRYDPTDSVEHHYVVATTCTGALFRYCIDTGEGYEEITSPDLGVVYATVNYRLGMEDVLLISCENGFYVLSDRNVSRVEDVPSFNSIAIHSERAFGTLTGERNRLWFSTGLDPTDWTVSSDKGGYVDFSDDGGRLVKVLSFRNYLYIFREYAIHRLSVYSDQTDFYMTRVYVSPHKINPHSISVCGDVIMFQAERGFYRFDGADVTPVMRECDELNIDASLMGAGVWYDGKYYLALRIDYDDRKRIRCEEGEYVFNTLAEYSPTDKRVNLMRGVDVSDMIPLSLSEGAKLLVTLNNEHHATFLELTRGGSVIKDPLPKLWRTGRTDVGYPDKRKLLRSIVLYTEHPMNVEIDYDGDVVTYPIRKGLNELRINRAFDRIAFGFWTEGERLDVSNPAITVDYR